jgi:hypothetical protein
MLRFCRTNVTSALSKIKLSAAFPFSITTKTGANPFFLCKIGVEVWLSCLGVFDWFQPYRHLELLGGNWTFLSKPRRISGKGCRELNASRNTTGLTIDFTTALYISQRRLRSKTDHNLSLHFLTLASASNDAIPAVVGDSSKGPVALHSQPATDMEMLKSSSFAGAHHGLGWSAV